MTQQRIHQFELEGLGKAPFRLVGFYQMPNPSLAEFNPSGYQSQLDLMPKDVSCGSCHYCGTPLKNNFIIESADQKKSVVGCDCVTKVGDRGLVDAVNALKRQQRREAKLAERQAAYEAKMTAQRERNGGLTDAEVVQQKKEAQDAAFAEGLADIRGTLREFGQALSRTPGDFAYRANQLLKAVDFDNLSPNMGNIIVEITAKTLSGARKGSNAYKAKYAELKPVMAQARAQYAALYQQIYG